MYQPNKFKKKMVSTKHYDMQIRLDKVAAEILRIIRRTVLINLSY